MAALHGLADRLGGLIVDFVERHPAESSPGLCDVGGGRWGVLGTLQKGDLRGDGLDLHGLPHEDQKSHAEDKCCTDSNLLEQCLLAHSGTLHIVSGLAVDSIYIMRSHFKIVAQVIGLVKIFHDRLSLKIQTSV